MKHLIICYDDRPNCEVYILPNKEGRYQFVNITKGHICPCQFSTIEEAMKDLENYPNIIEVVEWEASK